MHHLHPFFKILPGEARTPPAGGGFPLPHPSPAALRADLITPPAVDSLDPPLRCRAKLAQYTCIAPAKSDTDISSEKWSVIAEYLSCLWPVVYIGIKYRYNIYDRKEDQTDNGWTGLRTPTGPLGEWCRVYTKSCVLYWDLFRKIKCKRN